jgi:hypothetical protein
MTKRKRSTIVSVSVSVDMNISQPSSQSLVVSSKKQYIPTVHKNDIETRENAGLQHGKVIVPPSRHPNTSLTWRLLSMCKAMEKFLRQLLDPPPAVVDRTGIPIPFNLPDTIDYLSLQQHLIPLSWAKVMHEIHWLSQQQQATLPDKYAIDVLLFNYRKEKQTFESKQSVQQPICRTNTGI